MNISITYVPFQVFNPLIGGALNVKTKTITKIFNSVHQKFNMQIIIIYIHILIYTINKHK